MHYRHWSAPLVIVSPRKFIKTNEFSFNLPINLFKSKSIRPINELGPPISVDADGRRAFLLQLAVISSKALCTSQIRLSVRLRSSGFCDTSSVQWLAEPAKEFRVQINYSASYLSSITHTKNNKKMCSDSKWPSFEFQ